MKNYMLGAQIGLIFAILGNSTTSQIAVDIYNNPSEFSLTLFRLSTLLLWDATGDIQEGNELEGNPGLPTWSPHLREGQRPDIKVCEDELIWRPHAKNVEISSEYLFI